MWGKEADQGKTMSPVGTCGCEGSQGRYLDAEICKPAYGGFLEPGEGTLCKALQVYNSSGYSSNCSQPAVGGVLKNATVKSRPQMPSEGAGTSCPGQQQAKGGL